MHWINGELLDVTQALQYNNLIRMRLEEFRYRCLGCKKMFSCKEGWQRHKAWMVVCGKSSCTCDVFSYGKYTHSINTANKNYKRAIQAKQLKKLEANIELTMNNPDLIKQEKFKSALDTRRDIQKEKSL